MTPDEIVLEISRHNRRLYATRPALRPLDAEQVLALMDAAAMRAFQFGSNVALSMVQGALCVQLARRDAQADALPDSRPGTTEDA